MYKIYPILDMRNISYLINRDELYKSLFGIDDVKEFVPMHHHRYFVVAEEKDGDREYIGFLMVSLETPNSFAFHGGIYKQYRHKSSKILKWVVNQLEKELPDKVFWTRIPKRNKKAQNVVKAIGYKRTGVIPKAAKGDDLLIFTKDK